MKRYIDADALGIGKADRNAFTIPEFADGWNGAIEIIANAPTADVVEVVRCRDCKHWTDASFDTVTESHWGECRKPLGDYRYCETSEEDYCSYGERREDNGKS